eukprot:scaffold16206_cov134-Isochrysis_galbana.AAC.8
MGTTHEYTKTTGGWRCCAVMAASQPHNPICKRMQGAGEPLRACNLTRLCRPLLLLVSTLLSADTRH